MSSDNRHTGSTRVRRRSALLWRWRESAGGPRVTSQHRRNEREEPMLAEPQTAPRTTGDVPRTIRLNDADNVAIVVNAFGLPAGTVFPDGLTLREFVPQGHKVALADIAEG